MIESLNYTNIKECELQHFFDKTFFYFEKEINSLSKTIFIQKETHNVFALIERAWVGTLNNAIIRAFPEDAVTLQEFAVYDNNKKIVGRSDLLVHWTDRKKKEFYLLFEAKCHEELNGSTFFSNNEKNIDVINQAGRYYDAEAKYYNGKNVYLISIVFAWLRKNKILDKAKEYMNLIKSEEAPVHFCRLYHEKHEGMWVYGNIYKPLS